MSLPLLRSRIARSAIRTGGAVLAVVLGARVSVRLPGAAVPVTGQTLGVVLAGGLHGPGQGFVAMLVYLGAGACGLPVFAPGSRGLPALRGPGGGYLAAFPLAAALTGHIYGPAARQPGSGLAAGQPVRTGRNIALKNSLLLWLRDNDLIHAALATGLGHTVILAAGVAWLAYQPSASENKAATPPGLRAALRKGLFPLLPGAVAKSLLAALILTKLVPRNA